MGVTGHIRNPNRRSAFPGSTDEPHTPLKGPFPAVLYELGGLNLRRMPQVNETQQLSLLVYGPKHAQFPVQTFTDGPKDFMACVFQG